jgi:hypothetical protein
LDYKNERKEKTEPVSKPQTLQAGQLTDEKEDPSIRYGKQVIFFGK